MNPKKENAQLVRDSLHYGANENSKDFIRQVTELVCKNRRRQLQKGDSRAAIQSYRGEE